MNTCPERTLRAGNAHLPAAVACPDARNQAEVRTVGKLQRFGFVIEGHRAEHRTEHFFASKTMRRRDIAQECRRLVKARFGCFGNHFIVDGHRDAVVLGIGEKIPHALLLLRADERTAIEIEFARTNLQRAERLAQALKQRFIRRSLDQHATARRARLPSVLHDCRDEYGQGGVEVGIGENDLRRLAAEFERDGNVVVGGHLDHCRARWRRSRERDVIDPRMPRERRADTAAEDLQGVIPRHDMPGYAMRFADGEDGEAGLIGQRFAVEFVGDAGIDEIAGDADRVRMRLDGQR